jgi:hypothetical protein
VARLALRVLLARALLAWRRAGAQLAATDAAIDAARASMGRWRRRAEYDVEALGQWLDSQRFNALGCGLDRWRDHARGRHGRGERYALRPGRASVEVDLGSLRFV